jgi:hypothetical protein
MLPPGGKAAEAGGTASALLPPGSKAAVPCPHCDRRSFKYLRSLEKHVWNEHGSRLTSQELAACEAALRSGPRLVGPGTHCEDRHPHAFWTLVTQAQLHLMTWRAFTASACRLTHFETSLLDFDCIM